MTGLFIVTELLKKLTILKDVPISIFTDVDFRRLYLSKKIKLNNGKIDNKDKLTDEYLLHKHEVYTGRPDKTYTNNWITYQNLTNALLKYTITNCILHIQVDEGNFYDGKFEKNRWKGNFELDISEIHLFSGDIDRMFDSHIDWLFKEKEEIRIQKEKDKIRAKLLA